MRPPRRRQSPAGRGGEVGAQAQSRAGVVRQRRGGDRPSQLSGGQQSRAALARTLLAARPLILLDEAFAALGPALRQEMLDLVSREVAGPDRLVLMVSHDPADARQVAERTIVVADGAATGPFSPPELLADPPPALAAYLGPS